MSISSSFRHSSYAFDRSDSQISETMGSTLGYINDPNIINIESVRMVTPVSCAGTQLLSFPGMLFSYGGGEKASSTCIVYSGYGSALGTHNIRATPMTMHAAAAYGGYYLCHGGCSDLRSFKKTLLSPHKMLIINPASLSATKKKITGDIPFPRLSHRIHFVKPHTLFLAGGITATGFCKDCFLINVTTMESVYACDLPLPLAGFTIVNCNSKTYLIGGQTDGFLVLPVFYNIDFIAADEELCHGQADSKEEDRSVVESASVVKRVSFGAGLSGFASSLASAGAAAVSSGSSGSGNSSTYSTPKKNLPYRITFRKLPNPPFLPRRGHACATIGKYIILFGGTTGTRYFNDFWLYDSVLEQWKEINVYGEPPSKRYGAVMGVLDSSIIVAGGSNGIMQLHDAFYISAIELLDK